MFYVLFGIVLGNASDREDNATYMLATMGCFGVMAVALFGFGVSLAMERGQGWLQVKRASPMPVSAYSTGEAVRRSRVQRRHRVDAYWVRASPSAECACRYLTAAKLDRHPGGGIDSVQRDGPGPRATSPNQTPRPPWSTWFIYRSVAPAPGCGFRRSCCRTGYATCSPRLSAVLSSREPAGA